jgi:hypothetical protein
MRARGGFCFSSPCDFKSHKEDRAPINTDLAGGAVHGICEAFASIFEDNGIDLRIHLLISVTNRLFTLKSYLPLEGRIEIALHEPRNVLLRLPSDLNRAEVRVAINDEKKKAVWVGEYLSLGARSSGFTAELQIPLLKKTTSELINGKEFKISWIGNTVVSVTGPEFFFKELY